MRNIKEIVASLWPFYRASEDPVAIIESLYRTIDGGYISQCERARLQLNDTSLIYGEVLLPSFAAMLEVVRPVAGETLYDLGSGVGRAILFASLLYDFKKCVGIEIVPGLFQVSAVVLERFLSQPPSVVYPQRAPVELVERDFLQIDFADADIVSVNATTLNPVLWGELILKLNQLKTGARVMVTTKRLDEAYFEKLHQGLYPMSWADCTMFIYRKR
jgi:SAM-dependent methyltransferase